MSSVRCMANHFRKWPRSPRIWMVFLIMMTYCTPYFTTTIRQFCQDYDAACTGWLLPLALTVENRRLWIMLLPMLLFCDAPFLDEQQPFLIVRTGRLRWGAGQILYIFAASAVFYLVSFLIMALMLLPYLEFSLDWGKVIRTLSQGYITQMYAMDPLPEAVILQYTPLQATILCGAGTWVASSFIGLLMFLCNLWARREVGILLAGCFEGLAFFVERMAWFEGRYLSPVSWVNIKDIGLGTKWSPSWTYVFVTGGILLVVLSAAILFSVRKKSIEVIRTV